MLKPGLFNADPGFLAALAAGRISGHKLVVVQGHASGLTTTSHIIAVSGNVSPLAISAATEVSVASTNAANDDAGGSGALTVRLTGLDATYHSQIETVTMTGSAPATTSQTWVAINGIEVLTAGGSLTNVGNIHVGEGTFTSGVPATPYFTLEAEQGKATTGLYTVPNGYTLLPFHFAAMIRDTGKSVEFNIKSTLSGVSKVLVPPLAQGNGVFDTPIWGAGRATEKSQVSIAGYVNTATADVSCMLFCALIENAMIDP